MKTPERHRKMFARVKAAPMEDCKLAWDRFDDGLPRQTMDVLNRWAGEGASLETIWNYIYPHAKTRLDTMSESGREFFALCIEYAVRQARLSL